MTIFSFRSHILKEKIIKLIESGLQLSEYQARKAFSVYLHCILMRLSDYDDFVFCVFMCFYYFSVVDQQSCVDILNAFDNFLLSDQGKEQLKDNLEKSQDENEVQVVLDIVLPAWANAASS